METYTKNNPHKIDPKMYSREDYNSNGSIRSVTKTLKGTSEPTFTDSVTLGKNPLWRVQIARGDNATTLLQGRKYFVESYVPYYCDARYKAKPSLGTSFWGSRTEGLVYENDWSYPSATSVDNVSLVEARNAAKEQFLKHLINAQRTFQGSVALGEMRETLRMLRNPAKGLRSAVDRWHKRAVRLRERKRRGPINVPRSTQIKNLSRTLADSWLEEAFGWQPLINDTIEAGKAVNDLLNYSIREYVSGKAERENLDSIAYSNISMSLHTARKCLEKSSTSSVRYFGAIRPEYGNPQKFARCLMGFTAQDFVPTLWELTPWSFLIDYFTNVSQVLDGVSWGRTGLKWAYVTERKTYSHKLTYVPVAASNTELVASAVGRFVTSTTVVNRDTYGGYFTPDLRWELPGFRGRDLRKWVNMAALFRMRAAERLFKF